MNFSSKAAERQYYETEATEAEFLAWYAAYDLATYAKPSLAVDNVIFGYDADTEQVKVLLVRRKQHPFQGKWALPGAFVRPNEDTTQTTIRGVLGETGILLNEQHVEQLKTIGTPNRDPRGWIITVSHIAYLPTMQVVVARDDVVEARWFSFTKHGDEFTVAGIDLADLAFDHAEILQTAFQRVANRLSYAPTILQILGPTFSLPQAQNVYAQFLAKDFSGNLGSNFKTVYGKLFTETGLTVSTKGKGRPAKLYVLKD
ncbi:NUDIX domain-containing protein [Periweissella cryptocerci]|uniref:NUDIX domain-containing protein n=1 Tax=Periweissella cryptocerci TaxID=2506420 RepID=A0A4P6YWE0_9LACO|nr:NUDIX domain-containing protein [Periweissella cryptocerci]QBO37093.1 NUDIX domain-containing protein [Periweissella cryptocerci]